MNQMAVKPLFVLRRTENIEFSAIARKRLMVTAKWTIVTIVAVFIGRSFAAARAELISDQAFSVHAISVPWLCGAAICYSLAMIPMATYWYVLNRTMGQTATWWSTLRAHCLGQLGKYVPGKAFVVIMRTGALKTTVPKHVTIVATTVFIETFTLMAVGAALAALLILWNFAQHRYLLILATLLLVIAGIPTWPPLLRGIVSRLRSSSLTRELQSALQAYRWQTMISGWILSFVSWCLIGLSLECVMRALPISNELPTTWQLWPRLTASASLSVVAGFLSLIPGGLGVREAVLDQLLKQPFGPLVAFTVPVVLRLIWLLTELMLSVILYIGGRRHMREASPPS